MTYISGLIIKSEYFLFRFLLLACFSVTESVYYLKTTLILLQLTPAGKEEAKLSSLLLP